MKRIAALVMTMALTMGCSSTATEAKRSDECVAVSKALQKAVVHDNKPVGKAWAVKSDEFKNVYMVASQFKAGGSTETGVWAVNDLNPSKTTITAVDAFANEFTPWPNKVNGEALSIALDGAQDAVDCL